MSSFVWNQINRERRARQSFGVCPECGDHRRLVKVYGVPELVCQLCAVALFN